MANTDDRDGNFRDSADMHLQVDSDDGPVQRGKPPAWTDKGLSRYGMSGKGSPGVSRG